VKPSRFLTEDDLTSVGSVRERVRARLMSEVPQLKDETDDQYQAGINALLKEDPEVVRADKIRKITTELVPEEGEDLGGEKRADYLKKLSFLLAKEDNGE
jgi:hypothetical protein